MLEGRALRFHEHPFPDHPVGAAAPSLVPLWTDFALLQIGALIQAWFSYLEIECGIPAHEEHPRG